MGGVVLLNLFAFALAGLSLRQSYRNYQERAEITTRNLARTLESEIAGAIKADAMALFAVMDEYQRQRASGGVDGKALNAYIERVRSRVPEIDALRITDAQGMLIHGNDVVPSAKTSLADRLHFIRSRDDPKAGLVISKPQVSRANQKKVIVLARRIDQPEGSFAGMAFAAITLEHLSRTFSALNVGPRGVIALRDGDLDVIVRIPELGGVGGTVGDKVGNKEVAREFRERVAAGNTTGTFTVHAGSDNIERVYSYRKIGAHPLYLSVGLSTEDYLAEWRNEASKQAALVGLFTLMTLSAAWLIYRAWKQQAKSVEALSNQEAKFRTVADLTFDWEYWLGPQAEVLYMTPSCERVTGYTREQFLADPGLLLRIIHPDDRYVMERHLHDIAQQISDRDGARVEFRIVRRDGEIRWISHHCRGIVGRDSKPMGRRVANRDITEQKRMEQEREQYFRFFHLSIDPMCIADPYGCFKQVNPAFTQLTGFEESELVAKPFLDFILPEDRQKTADEMKHQVEVRPSLNFENRYVCKDGRIVILSWMAYFDKNDGVTYATARDITEVRRAEEALRRSEARFRQMFENNDSVMLLVDPDSGEIVDANAAAARFYGYPIEHLKAMRIDRINTLSPDEIAAKQAQVTGHESNFFIFRHRLASGETRTVEVRSTPIELSTRVVIFSIVQDITEREIATAELKRSNAELEQFSYAISHDMRQPLRMISSYLKLLEMSLADQLDEEKRGYFDFAVDGAKRLDAMLLGLLDYSRVGRKGEPPAWVESRAVLDEALLFLRPAIAEAQATVRIEGDWPRVFVSPDEMLRLMQNLIGNALKFRVAGRIPEIIVTSETSGKEWGMSVADNGVGIVPDQIGRLFQVFQRLQSRAAYDGTGIGLALCRKIVEHHGGRIWAESAGEGLGSTFKLSLPIRDPDGAGAPGAAS